MRLRVVAYVFFSALLAVGQMVMLAWAAQLSLAHQGEQDSDWTRLAGAIPPKTSRATAIEVQVNPAGGSFSLDKLTDCQWAVEMMSGSGLISKLSGDTPPLVDIGHSISPISFRVGFIPRGHSGSRNATLCAGQISYVLFTVDKPVSIKRIDIGHIGATCSLSYDPTPQSNTLLHDDIPGYAQATIGADFWDYTKDPGPYDTASAVRSVYAKPLVMTPVAPGNSVYYFDTRAWGGPLDLSEATWSAHGEPTNWWDKAPLRIEPGRVYAIGVHVRVVAVRFQKRIEMVADFKGTPDKPAGVSVGDITVHYGPPSSPSPYE